MKTNSIMKTPREILLKHHQAIGPKLDAARQAALSSLADPGRGSAQESAGFWPAARALVLSMRWHLAGMSAAWLLVVILNHQQSPLPAAALAKENSSTPRQLLLALRENRRQLLELIEPPATEAPAPSTIVPPRRSEIVSSNAVV